MIPQNFSTPQYPDFYRYPLECEWMIETLSVNESILLIFYDFETERCCDVVKVSKMILWTSLYITRQINARLDTDHDE